MYFPSLLSFLIAAPLASTIPTSGSGVGERDSGCKAASKLELSSAKQKFIASGLVPEFISKFDPTLLANITYTQALGGSKEVDFGNKFKTTETALQPTVFLTPEKGQCSNSTYSVLFLNFDNPNAVLPPKLHLPFLHWQESGLMACSTASATSTQLFIASVPQSINENRYTFLIYREPPGYVPNAALTASRVITNVDQFATSQNLTLVGGNYFLEGQENNVPPT